MIRVDEVSAGYGKLQILNGISVEARPEEITVIVGPNGSGKSTLLKTIAGLTNIYKGSITLDGTKISGLPPHKISRMGIAYLPQIESTFTHLTVAENFKMAGYTVGRLEYEERLARAFDVFPKLSVYMNSK